MAKEQATSTIGNGRECVVQRMVLQDGRVVAVVDGKLSIVGQFIPVHTIGVKRKRER